MKQDPGEIVKNQGNYFIAEHYASSANTDLHMYIAARVMVGWSDPEAP